MERSTSGSGRWILEDQNGAPLEVQNGESYNLRVVFSDVADTPVELEKANLTAVKLTLYSDDGTIINGRNSQDVKDANQGKLTDAGVLTVMLGPLDQIIVGSAVAVNDFETHIAKIEWNWLEVDADATPVTRVGISEYEFKVQKKSVPS